MRPLRLSQITDLDAIHPTEPRSMFGLTPRDTGSATLIVPLLVIAAYGSKKQQVRCEKDQMNRYVIPTVVEQYPLDRGGL